MVKILLSGCCGKMGTVISNLVNEFPNLEIIGGIDKFPQELSYPIFKTPEEVNIEYDVLLDFSNVSTLHGLLKLTEKTKKPLVICSTGYNQADLDLINEKSKTLPLFKSANMSLGINLINSLLRKVTPLLYGNYDIEIIEKHHNQKLDSPSGTALLLADTIKDSISEETHYVHGRDGHKKREKNEIGIYYGFQMTELQDMINSTNSFKKIMGIAEGRIIIDEGRGLNGFYIQELVKEGSAYVAGVKPTDIILEVDGYQVVDVEDVITVLQGKRKDDILHCKILRQGNMKEVDIKIIS